MQFLLRCRRCNIHRLHRHRIAQRKMRRAILTELRSIRRRCWIAVADGAPITHDEDRHRCGIEVLLRDRLHIFSRHARNVGAIVAPVVLVALRHCVGDEDVEHLRLRLERAWKCLDERLLRGVEFFR